MATRTAWSGVRTLWSRPMPLSQTGYQIASAMPASALDLSLVQQHEVEVAVGAGSRRPTPPTATSATPSGAPSKRAQPGVEGVGEFLPQRGADKSGPAQHAGPDLA